MKILVSIIIPTFNREKNLIEAIKSILKNNFNEYEIIVVDDGSTDNTKEKVKNLNSEKINYFWIKNSERGAARNFGAKKARGLYLNFFDSDDILYDNHLESAASIIKSNKKNEIFHLSYEILDQKTGNKKKIINNGNTNKKILSGNSISCNSLFLKKNIFNEFKFDENRNLSGSEDWDLWLRLSRYHKIYNYSIVTSMIVNHQYRSMNERDTSKITKRLNIISNKIKNDIYKNLSNLEKNKILAHIYSFESLHYSFMTKKKIYIINLLIKSIIRDPIIVFNLRSLLIIKNILLKW